MRHGIWFLNFPGYFALTKTHGRIAVFWFLVIYKGLLTHTIDYQRLLNLKFNICQKYYLHSEPTRLTHNCYKYLRVLRLSSYPLMKEEGGSFWSLRTLRSCGVLVDWGGSLVEWSFMVTLYNPVDGLATRSYVQMVSSWCYHCFRILGGGEDT